jgi:hypothetical protein
VNLSNTPFRGIIEAEPGSWKEVALPVSESGQSALPAVALDAFKFRVFKKQSAKPD